MVMGRPGAVKPPNGFKTSFYIDIHSPGCKTTRCIAQLDTGSDVNVISQDTVEDINMSMEPYGGERVYPLGAEPIQPIGQLKLRWNVKDYKKTYTTTYVVLDKNSSRQFDILIGTRTIGEVGFYEVNNLVWYLSNEPEV